MPEAFRLALGAVVAAGLVEAFQRLVAGRVDLDLGFEGEGGRGLVDDQALVRERVGAARWRHAVDQERDDFQAFAVQFQRLHAGSAVVGRCDCQGGFDPRGVGRQIELQRHGNNAVGGRGVVLKTDDFGGGGGGRGVVQGAGNGPQPNKRAPTVAHRGNRSNLPAVAGGDC